MEEKGIHTSEIENTETRTTHTTFEILDNDHQFKHRLLRKLDLKLQPLLCILYLLSFLDRSNIGNAKLGGLGTDLGLTTSQYQWALSIFFFGYVIFELPSNLVLRRWRPSLWLAILMCAWGIVATAMAGVTNYAGLMICRLLLGGFEAGFFPGVIYYMSLWYPRREQARRLGFFWSFGSLAGAFGGLLAFGISQIPQDRLKTWQWLFLLEGIPCIALAVFTAWYLPDKPENAKFLTEEEREYEIQRLVKDAGVANDHSWSWEQVASVFGDWKTYVYMAIYLTGTIALQGVTLFLPSIVAGMGTWPTAVAQALTTPPYFLAFLATIAVGWSSDRFLERAFHMVGINIISLAGFLILMFADRSQVGVLYFGAILVTMTVYANVAIKITWFNNNYGGLTRRAVASAAIVSVGTIGGAIGGQIYYDAPKYFAGNTIAFSCMAAQTILVISLRVIFKYENARRENLTEEQKVAEIAKYGGIEIAGDRHPNFRYIL